MRRSTLASSEHGRVLDENKNVVPGVTITAKNVATGLTRTAVSGESGT